jgi:hypothetical protein
VNTVPKQDPVEDLKRELRDKIASVTAKIHPLDLELEGYLRALSGLEGEALEPEVRRINHFVKTYLKILGGCAPRADVLRELKKRGIAEDSPGLRNDQDSRVTKSINACIRTGTIEVGPNDTLCLPKTPPQK